MQRQYMIRTSQTLRRASVSPSSATRTATITPATSAPVRPPTRNRLPCPQGIRPTGRPYANGQEAPCWGDCGRTLRGPRLYRHCLRQHNTKRPKPCVPRSGEGCGHARQVIEAQYHVHPFASELRSRRRLTNRLRFRTNAAHCRTDCDSGTNAAEEHSSKSTSNKRMFQ